MSAPEPTGRSTGPTAPVGLLVAAGICALQGLALAVLAVSVVISAGDDRASSWGRFAYFVVFAVILGVVAWFLAKARRWARGPFLVIELIVVLIGVTEAGLSTLIGWALFLPALVAIIAVFTPSAMAALNGTDAEST